MSDEMNNNNFFRVDYFVDNSIIAFTEFGKTRKITFQSFWLDCFGVFRQPVYLFDNSTRNLFIKFF